MIYGDPGEEGRQLNHRSPLWSWWSGIARMFDRAADAKSDGDDGRETVVILARGPAHTLLTNYSETPNSCLELNLPLLRDHCSIQ